MLKGQDELRVGKRLLKGLPFGLNAMMFGGHLLEASGCLSQGAEDMQEIRLWHSGTAQMCPLIVI